ncbi:two-component sensor histidine kinase [Saccharibacillus sp. O16]|nr:two-component sensor histidine kinase [Saccharibacillus sp. O16]
MRTIRGKLLLSMSAAVLVTIAVTLGLFVRLIDDLMINQVKVQLHGQVRKALHVLDHGDLSELDRVDFNYIVRDSMLDADYLILDDNQRVISASESAEIGKVLHTPMRSSEGIGKVDGTKVLYTQAKLNNLPYHIFLYSPMSSVRGLYGSIMQTTLLSTAVSFLIILLIGLWTVAHIVKPLNRLKEAVDHYEPGRPAADALPKDLPGEIGDLGRTFRFMAERIAEHQKHQVEFLQNVSHELRTPLMSIDGYSYAIRDGVVDQEEGLEVIASQSRRMVDMVDKLLTLSRLEALDESWPSQPIELDALAQEAMGLLRPSASARGIALSLTGGPLTVQTTGEHLFQLVLNLLQNAVRHTQTEVVVALEQSGDRGWELHVDDDGPGLGDEEVEAVFHRFYAGRNGITGLGLAISRQIAVRLGGELSYARSPLGGARFTLSLPSGVQASMEEDDE